MSAGFRQCKNISNDHDGKRVHISESSNSQASMFLSDNLIGYDAILGNLVIACTLAFTVYVTFWLIILPFVQVDYHLMIESIFLHPARGLSYPVTAVSILLCSLSTYYLMKTATCTQSTEFSSRKYQVEVFYATMGNNKSVFTSEQMEMYQLLEFKKMFIDRIYNRFRAIMPDQLPLYMDADQLFTLKIPKKTMLGIEEFRENPFREQVLKVFTEDGTGNMCFNDFVNMLSIMCESSPRELKSHYCFKIHDFDGDGYLNKSDMEKALKYITNNELDQEELDYITSKIIEESDLDEDSRLSEVEFELMLSKSPDFLR